MTQLTRFFRPLLLILLLSVTASGCGSDNQSDSTPTTPELPAPLMLDYMIPAGEIEVGEVAIIVLDDPMNWEMRNNSPEIVELQPAIDDGTMQTNFAVTALKLGTANLYAEKDGLGQSFTIEVVAKKENRELQIADSEFSLTLPGFLADLIEFEIQMDEFAAETSAVNASYIHYNAEDGEQRFGSFAWVLPVSVWDNMQNPDEPPLGDEMVRVGEIVLVVAGPQDLPFNDRYGNDANRYSALATLLNQPETYRYTP